MTAQSPRAKLRDLRHQVEAAARERFGQNFPLRVYADTSDGDPRNFDACVQYTVKPPEKLDWLLFPVDHVITASTEEGALQGLLRALERKTKT